MMMFSPVSFAIAFRFTAACALALWAALWPLWRPQRRSWCTGQSFRRLRAAFREGWVSLLAAPARRRIQL
jgi:hypothetical protein